MADYYRPVHSLLGLPIDALTMPQAARRLEDARARGERCFFTTPNLNFAIQAQDDAGFRASVCRSDLCVADGMPLVWLSRLLGIPVPERVSGSGLFDWLRAHSAIDWRVFFFGGPPGAAALACDALGAAGSSMRPSGHLYPGFGSVEQMSRTDWIEHIHGSRTNFLVVSLGSQKGQAWISQNLDALGPIVVSHLGAVVNFVAGTVKRAPGWMQHTGLEWAWRVKEEPRLARRYLGDGLALLKLVATRVLPLMLLQRTRRPDAAEFDRARVRACEAPGTQAVALEGAWDRSNLDPVRAAFSKLSRQGGNVTLDFAGVTYLDSALAGLLLLLQVDLVDRGLRLAIERPQPRVRRLLELHGVALDSNG